MVNSIVYIGKEDKTKSRAVKVNSVLYLEGFCNYSMFHTVDKMKLSALTLKVWEYKMGDLFVRISRKYLVNKNYIKHIDTKELTLLNGERLTISRRRIKDMKNIFLIIMMFLFTVNAYSQIVDMKGVTVEDLKTIRGQIYDKYALSDLPYTDADTDLLNRVNDAINKNPRVNATFAFSKMPTEYLYGNIVEMGKNYGQYVTERDKYRKFKRLVKMVYAVDTNIVNNVKKDYFKLPREVLLEIINEQ